MKDGEYVLLVSEDANYITKIEKGKMNTNDGMFDLAVIKKKKFGDKVKTSSGKTFTLARPTINDILKKRVKRSAQVMLPKDIVSIISNTGMQDSSLIIDSGTGTGYLSIYLAKIFPNSKIVGYELDKNHYKIALANMKSAQVTNVKIKNKDITKGITEKKADLITLDLKDSYKAIPFAYKSLSVGGWLVVYSPTADHLLRTSKALSKEKFNHLKIVENIEREWQFTKTVRPKTMGMMHTGFLTFARKF